MVIAKIYSKYGQEMGEMVQLVSKACESDAICEEGFFVVGSMWCLLLLVLCVEGA